MATPPAGTVTFLFTDIEGSTRLWEEQPGQMQVALARHDALLRKTIESHGGHVFKTMGDAFCAAFADPATAVEAALRVQRAIGTDEQLRTGVGSLRLRMALHTGTAEQRDGDYLGPPLNRVARLLSAAHGGQVLLSRAACELVRDNLPEGTSLRDLGEHRLKDLIRPEQIFQLTAPDLAGDFPPLRTLNARPHNLPIQSTPLIGREKEIREVAERLQRREVRLLTLTGPGGTGKTRLSLQVAVEQGEQFSDGVFFVNLAPVADPARVPSAIAQALGVREVPEHPLAQTLTEHLKDKQMLLLLDNVEQVTEAASFVSTLLSGAEGLKVLATSRIPLHLHGEHEYAVPPLALPDPEHLPPLERLTQYESVRLFIERAQATKADFQVTKENAPAVAEICHRLDGLPLAIELAAARIKILPPQAMLSRLQSRLKLLVGGARDLPARQQTLRGAIDWSHELLSGEEKVLFRRLSVFSGGRTLEAVESVCNAEGELDVLEGIASLVDKSLLKQEEDATGEPRFVMLETIYEYARERLEESGEQEAVRQRHAQYFLALAEEARPHLFGPQHSHWLERLEAEHDNFRAALRWALDRGEIETAAQLAGRLASLWVAHAHLAAGRQWLEEVLSQGDACSPEARARALVSAGNLAWQQQDLASTQGFYEESLALSQQLQDLRGEAMALMNLGAVAGERGDNESAKRLFEESVALLRALGEKRLTAVVLNNLGVLATLQDDTERAMTRFEESLVLSREVGDESGTGWTLGNLGHLAYDQRDYERAGTLFREGLLLARAADNVINIVHSLADLALVTAAAGQVERAARLFGVAEAGFTKAGAQAGTSDRAKYDRCIAAQAPLHAAAWERAYQEGAAMTLEEAIAYALEEGEPAQAEDATRAEVARRHI